MRETAWVVVVVVVVVVLAVLVILAVRVVLVVLVVLENLVVLVVLVVLVTQRRACEIHTGDTTQSLRQKKQTAVAFVPQVPLFVRDG